MTNKGFNKYFIIKQYLDQITNLSAIAINTGISLRTLQRWVTKYNKKGLENLEQKQRSDKGKYRRITDQTKGIIEGLFLHKQNITITNITKKINEYCIEQNIRPTSYHKVRKVVQGIPKDMVTLAKHGGRYTDKYEIIMRRESKYSN